MCILRWNIAVIRFETEIGQRRKVWRLSRYVSDAFFFGVVFLGRIYFHFVLMNSARLRDSHAGHGVMLLLEVINMFGQFPMYMIG